MLERLSTGIDEIDQLVEGGIPKGFTVLLTGNPGTGKTILASHFLYQGLQNKESCIYVSFSESKAQFYDNFGRFKMDFLSYEKNNKFVFLDFSSVTREGIGDALEQVVESCKNLGCKRLVIDSYSAIQLAFDDIIESRIALQVVLGKILRSEGITTLLIVEIPFGTNNIGKGIEEFVADGIIELEHGYSDHIPILLRVIKMRSTNILRQQHVCVIKEKGMIVYPKVVLSKNPPVSTHRIKTGITGLDGRADGGILKNTTTALVGPTGSGKTTFGFQFISEGVLRGEIGLFCSLEESPEQIKILAQSLGFDFNKLEKMGFHILSCIPQNQSTDEFISYVISQIERVKPSRLVIDGLSGFKFLSNNEMYFLTKSLSNLCQSNGITSIITILQSQQSGLAIGSLGISSIFQNIILLRYVEIEGQLKRSLLLLKMRATKHDLSFLEFSISSKKGIKIIAPLKKYTGILTGTAQKTYQRYLDKEQKIKSTEYKDRENRKKNLYSDPKKISNKDKHNKNKSSRKRI